MVKQNLIVVDDDKITHFIFKKMFERNPFFLNPIHLEDATKAIHFIKKEYTTKENYVIFLDINMPIMNGWQFLEVLSQHFSPSNTFVIMVSSSNDNADVIKATRNKLVIHFITKPLNNDDLLVVQEKIQQLTDK